MSRRLGLRSVRLRPAFRFRWPKVRVRAAFRFRWLARFWSTFRYRSSRARIRFRFKGAAARMRPAAVWRRIAFRWHARERGGLAALAMAAVPVVAIGSIVSFARSGHSVDDAAVSAAAQVRARELQCLAENIYYEARGEPLDGQYAVAEVTLNRVRSPRYADTICEVVYDTRWDPLRRRRVGHFSWTELQDLDDPWGPAWEQAMSVATAVYDESYMPLVPGALHYHAVGVHPYWAGTLPSVGRIGNHVFYR